MEISYNWRLHYLQHLDGGRRIAGLEHGCIRFGPQLIWNRLGCIVTSCETCFLNTTCPIQSIHQKERDVCPRCGSINLKKLGKYRRKTNNKNFPIHDRVVQRFRCKECNHKFVNRKYKCYRVPSEVIDFALSLAERQVPLRKIVERIKEKFGIEISHPAIGRWVRNLSDIKLPKGRPHDAEWRQKISRALKKRPNG